MDRRKFFKNLFVGAAAVSLAKFAKSATPQKDFEIASSDQINCSTTEFVFDDYKLPNIDEASPGDIIFQFGLGSMVIKTIWEEYGEKYYNVTMLSTGQDMVFPRYSLNRAVIVGYPYEDRYSSK